jgi:hypothetical protein
LENTADATQIKWSVQQRHQKQVPDTRKTITMWKWTPLKRQKHGRCKETRPSGARKATVLLNSEEEKN